LVNATLQTFSGSHYEIGVQQGQATRGLLQKALAQIQDFEVLKQMKPRLLPAPVFLALAKRRANKLFRNDIFENYPKQAQRLKGIAEGVGVSISTILFMQSIELLIGQKSKSSYHLQACTSLGFRPARTLTEETFLAKNFDYPPEYKAFHLTCLAKPTDGFQTLGCTMAPLSGMLEGINEHGLAVTYNYTYTIDKPTHFVPLSIVLQEMLETCKNANEAVRFIKQAKRAGSALLTFADAENDIKVVEISSNHASVREDVGNQIVVTNHYDTPEMQKFEIPHTAVYSGKAPKTLHGIRVHESSERRLKRASELLKGKVKIDENKIVAVLRDHGRESKPSMMTICRHSEFGSTLRSVIFHPNRRILKVLYGNPCQNEYAEFTF
jgi:isopenicillin-N N-acyltransferase-like protein